jgi:dynein light chain roadblock-type
MLPELTFLALVQASGVVRAIDETDQLTFLRIRSKKHEIMVAPDAEYSLIVVQNATSTGRS